MNLSEEQELLIKRAFKRRDELSVFILHNNQEIITLRHRVRKETNIDIKETLKDAVKKGEKIYVEQLTELKHLENESIAHVHCLHVDVVNFYEKMRNGN